MTYSAALSYRLDTEIAPDDDRAVLNVFQVLAINIVCSVTLISVALMYDLGWWMVALVGWLGGSVATLVIAVAIVVLWPVESHRAARHAAQSLAQVSDTLAHIEMWNRDLASERAAAARPAPSGLRAHPSAATGPRPKHALFGGAAVHPAGRSAA